VTTTSASAATPRRSIGRSIWAVLAGFIVIFVLSLGTDAILHLLKVYPPWNEPMWDPRLNALALSYRLVFDTMGSYLTAKLAPYAPMRHALIGGFIGLVLTLAGLIMAAKGNFGPLWYPIALALSSPLTAWVGGRLFIRNASGA
jgi:hypothetical protein